MHENKQTNSKQEWEEYCEQELAQVRPILSALGFELDPHQPHLAGERYLMSTKKLVLIGRRANDDRRVVIKVSSETNGIREITREQDRYTAVKKINFAYSMVLLPENFLFIEDKKHVISVFEYIVEEKSYRGHSLPEQFSLILRAFKSQESIHATTYSHLKTIRKIFGITNAREYLKTFHAFHRNIFALNPENTELATLLPKAQEFLRTHVTTIERYCDFFVHTDFVPHNFRVVGKDIYLLDHTSFRFGNKYESWARFLNYMIIYNPALRNALLQYVKDNRNHEEYLSLRLMCVYKLGFLLEYYAKALAKTEGDLRALTQERLNFWTHILQILLDDKQIPEDLVAEYKNARDRLRSEEENRRQKELRQL